MVAAAVAAVRLLLLLVLLLFLLGDRFGFDSRDDVDRIPPLRLLREVVLRGSEARGPRLDSATRLLVVG